ncbi:hypothetical protein T439DRAFT_323258 [Meredithblackwellia eburnea MCA 4105]
MPTLTLLGTGTSSALPSIHCLTSPRGCYACRSTLPDGHENRVGIASTGREEVDEIESGGNERNKRWNTCAVVTFPGTGDEENKNGAKDRDKLLLIDCGKTFWTSSQYFFPRNGWREIDAVLLTHAHADAILGLDDLRGWTLHGSVQKSVAIYASQETFDEISRAFPYLTNAGKATGGGDVPALSWHIIKPFEPFVIEGGLEVVGLPVEHGKYLETGKSYECLGFILTSKLPSTTTSTQDSLLYLSDVSAIPAPIYSYINDHKKTHKITKTILDCLRIRHHASHFGIGAAVEAIRNLDVGVVGGANEDGRTVLVGFGHQTSHASWVSFCRSLLRPSMYPSSLGEGDATPRALRSEPAPEPKWVEFTGSREDGQEDRDVFAEYGRKVVMEWDWDRREVGVQVEPGWDGMSVTW